MHTLKTSHQIFCAKKKKLLCRKFYAEQNRLDKSQFTLMKGSHEVLRNDKGLGQTLVLVVDFRPIPVAYQRGNFKGVIMVTRQPKAAVYREGSDLGWCGVTIIFLIAPLCPPWACNRKLETRFIGGRK